MISLIEEGYQAESIIESDGNYFMQIMFSHWDGIASKMVEPKKICQIPVDTTMKDKSYKNDGDKGYCDYYDSDQYFWSEDLQEGHMYAACDEEE